jgi:hypothetical protein
MSPEGLVEFVNFSLRPADQQALVCVAAELTWKVLKSIKIQLEGEIRELPHAD